MLYESMLRGQDLLGDSNKSDPDDIEGTNVNRPLKASDCHILRGDGTVSIDRLNSHVIRFFLPRHKKMAKNYNNEVLFTRNDKRPWLCSWRALQREWGLASVDDVPRALLTTPDWYLISKIGN